MATETRPARTLTKYGAYQKPDRGSNGWETFSWYFFRVSGVGLIVLALVHVFIMHVSNDVSATVYDFVAARYANPFWRAYDLLLLTLALLHGLNGLRIATEDYIQSRGWRLSVTSALFLIALAFWLMGAMTIITFQPNHTLAQSILGLFGH
jgi:succinate dehydrogenase / fumarate reductase membrane anchor subunit